MSGHAPPPPPPRRPTLIKPARSINMGAGGGGARAGRGRGRRTSRAAAACGARGGGVFPLSPPLSPPSEAARGPTLIKDQPRRPTLIKPARSINMGGGGARAGAGAADQPCGRRVRGAGRGRLPSLPTSFSSLRSRPRPDIDQRSTPPPDIDQTCQIDQHGRGRGAGGAADQPCGRRGRGAGGGFFHLSPPPPPLLPPQPPAAIPCSLGVVVSGERPARSSRPLALLSRPPSPMHMPQAGGRPTRITWNQFVGLPVIRLFIRKRSFDVGRRKFPLVYQTALARNAKGVSDTLARLMCRP